jgi:primosomal protein N'
MFLLTVAPIRRGIPVAELSYICKEAPPIGAVILVPLRKKDIPAIVLETKPVREAKAAIKGADFSLRKIDKIQILNKFSPSFISAAKEISSWSISTLGATVQAIFPTALLEDGELINIKDIENPSDVKEEDITRYLPSVLQAEEAERMAIYKSHIREIFARGGSIFFILPTIQDIERVDAAIGKGIGSYTFILHSNLTKKQIKDRLKEIAESDHSTLIIATPQFLAVPCKNLQSIILERESASSYTMTHKPFIDLRRFVEAYAKERRIPLLFGDLFLRVETLTRLKKGELDSFTRPKARYSSTAETHLIDMRESGEMPGIGKVAFFSKQLVSLISETRKRGASTFILCVRRGVAPMTVCGDCGTVVECSNCNAPLILHRKSSAKPEVVIKEEMETSQDEGEPESVILKQDDNTLTLDEDSALGVTLPGIGFQAGPVKNIPEYENVFICHRCGEKSDPKHKCEKCGSWKLTMLGLGIGQAEDILKARFPDSPVFRIDTDSIKKHKEAKERAEAFLSTPGAIMLGTEMALPYITESVGLVAVLSVNSLLTIPDFKMSEHVFRLLLVLREKAREHFLIQARELNPIFPLALKGNIGEFLEEELSLRKELHFPPYSIFIKVTFEGNKYAGQEFLSNFNEKLNDLGIPTVNYPQYITKKGVNVLMSALICLPKKSWPNERLAEYLYSLPPNISVRVEPKSILGD